MSTATAMIAQFAAGGACRVPSAPAGWPSPPSLLPTLPPVPPFPLGVLPGAVARYWKLSAESIGVPVDYVAVPGLAVLGAAVGRAREAAVKPGFAKPPLLWTAVVAPPSAGKSPALKAACGPLWKAEQKWRAEFESRRAEFEAAELKYKADYDAWRKAGGEGDPPAKPPKPMLRQLILDDVTAESAARVIAANERGVALVKDELSGFVLALGQYKGGRGADRQFWLSAWAVAASKVNRAGDRDAPPLLVPRPFAAVAGALCPELLPTLRGDSSRGDAPADGFIDRFLLSYPDPLPATGETWAEVPGEAAREYEAVVNNLIRLAMAEDAGDGDATCRRPVVMPLNDGAKQEWSRLSNGVAARMNAIEADDPFRATLGKLREYGVRLACLLRCLRLATESPAEPGKPAAIDAGDMAGAAELIDYFEAHARRCQGLGVTDRAGRVARRLVRWLASRPDLAAFTRSEAFQRLKDRRDVRAGEALNAPLQLLSDFGYVRQVAGDAGGRPGPVPQSFAVNPLWVRGPAPAGGCLASDDDFPFGANAGPDGDAG